MVRVVETSAEKNITAFKDLLLHRHGRIVPRTGGEERKLWKKGSKIVIEGGGKWG